METLICKLVTGEEVMGEVVLNTNIIRLKNPVQLSVVRSTRGVPSVGFGPFPTYTAAKKDDTIDLNLQHVVYSYVPAEDFVKNYDQIFGVGIILPGQQQIITG